MIFVNKEIYILRKDAGDWIDEEEEVLSEWIGFEIIDAETEKSLGKIEAIEDSTSNILFILRNDNDEEILVPANEDFIEEIDEEGRRVIMKLPDGLVDIN